MRALRKCKKGQAQGFGDCELGGKHWCKTDKRGSQGSWRGWGRGSLRKQSGPGINCQLSSFLFFKATECSLHTKPTLEIQHEKYETGRLWRELLREVPQGSVWDTDKEEQESVRCLMRTGRHPRACVGGSAPPAAALIPTSLLPPRPSRPHTANSLFLPLWCVFKYEKTNKK